MSYLDNQVYGPLIIVGDFNIHVDDDVKKFLDMLYSPGLTQHVTYPTIGAYWSSG